MAAALRKDAPKPAPAGDKPARTSARNSAARIQTIHAQAARRLGIARLALSAEESQDLAGAFDKMGDLTGFQPTGPFFDWLAVSWTLATVYGGRLMDIAAERRKVLAEAESRARAASDPGEQARRQAATPGHQAAPSLAPVPAARISPNPAGARPATAAATAPAVPDIATLESAFVLNGGGVAGLGIPGVPTTTADERNGGL